MRVLPEEGGLLDQDPEWIGALVTVAKVQAQITEQESKKSGTRTA